ncbi:peptide receptor GPCR [Elysia marginata]|uniref:Peptide receptor GPCR n=1 Tax=Elysia marginata TaxID=1093978 RepID=A0AAV4IP48_9GAST|nr:peptide receptor GPCR [Elysia marginata]
MLKTPGPAMLILYVHLFCGLALSTKQTNLISSKNSVSQGSPAVLNNKIPFGLKTSRTSDVVDYLMSNASMTTRKTSITTNKPSRHIQFLDTDPGKWLYWSLNYAALPIISAICVFSNIVNISIFLKVGLRDGASVIFLGLSFSDMFYCCIKLVHAVLRSLESVMYQYPFVRLSHLGFILGYYARMFFDISVLITVFAGVQKCACVATPLTFRKFFTFRRSLTTIVLMYVCPLIYYLPQFTNSFLWARVDPQFNRTRLMVRHVNLDLAWVLFSMNKAVNRISIPFVAETVLIFCVAIMTHKLRQAAATRYSMTSTSVQEKQSASVGKGDTGSKLSAKELRVIRSVNIICLIFIVGTAPRCIIEGCDLALDEFGDHMKLYYFLSSIQELIIHLSIAANILVYYMFNAKYRESFREIFSGCHTATKSGDD